MCSFGKRRTARRTTPRRRGQKGGAHAAADSYDDIEVQQVEITTDRANILRLLNVAGGTDIPKAAVYTAAPE
jgi:hypothetical protein